ncbi:putative nuclease HARBI1 [Anoplophora glabripennis]|uniref:putative nuclease HARBI1 n=1 Tax=Anoplophora glabripennis TaxID=217634 RepID=UPI000C77F8E8|nr:putative nuclease HARBI1 [Anoplophora glabripennis]
MSPYLRKIVLFTECKFLNVIARWPGSTHDATIFGNSNIRAQFEGHHFPNCILLGDSGYPLTNYFLTPLANPVTQGQQLYNEAHIRTRNIIERLIGVWKRRFPVIAYGIRLKLETVKTVIIATTVLHNLAREMNEPEPPVTDDIDAEELNYLIEIADIPNIAQDDNVPIIYIQHMLVNHFSNI